MKKILMVFVAAVSFGLVSCDGAKKSTDEAATETQEAVEATTTETAVEASEKSLLAQYEEFVNKAIPLMEKVKGGDATAAQEYAKLTEELGKFVQENQEAFTKLTEEEAAKYAELAQKLLDATK